MSDKSSIDSAKNKNFLNTEVVNIEMVQKTLSSIVTLKKMKNEIWETRTLMMSRELFFPQKLYSHICYQLWISSYLLISRDTDIWVNSEDFWFFQGDDVWTLWIISLDRRHIWRYNLGIDSRADGKRMTRGK